MVRNAGWLVTRESCGMISWKRTEPVALQTIKSPRVKPIGARNIPGKSIQVISAALAPARAKTKQAQMKLTPTARREMNALRLGARWVKRTMTRLARSGVNKTYHGKGLIIAKTSGC